MNIILHRIRHRPDTIDGIIKISGLKVCDCAENAHHCLPPGEYPIAIVKCSRLGRKMPVVCLEGSTAKRSVTPYEVRGGDSERNTCLEGSTLLSYGNGVFNLTTGTIIVGRHHAPDILSHSRPTFNTLYDRIRKNIERGSPVTITIQ